MRRVGISWIVLAGCGPVVLAGDGETTGIGEVGSDVTTAPPQEEEEADDAGDEWRPDLWHDDPAPACTAGAPCLLDILVVIDNSATMGPTQEALVRGLVELVGELEEGELLGLSVDVQMMFTTTDMGNPICAPFNKPDYTPAMGAPTVDACNSRLNRFTALGNNPAVLEELCTDFCPADVAPADPFVAFATNGSSNVEPGLATPADIDGDGVEDSPAKRAVGCVAPQGIDGCGYEAPLEAMLHALDPAAAWNTAERPFLRDDSRLVVVIATDEADCSMTDYAAMFDEQYWNVNPNSGEPQASSALCWNAGVACEGPDAQGVYTDCVPTDGPLAAVGRYGDHFEWIEQQYGTQLHMIGILGVPAVTAHAPAPPFEPVAGGALDLVVHDWNEADLLPSELEDSTAVEELRWDFGIGPGCAVVDADAGHVARALPNHRVNDVCRALDDDAHTRCCIESACDPIAGLDCIIGWSAEPSMPPGG
jgi:hypothetical protein